MSGISTHVLDTSSGRPVAGLLVRLHRGDREINSLLTNKDGRCPQLLPDAASLLAGAYRLVFETAICFPDGFYPEVSIVFVVRDATAHHHVPLLLSPFGYTTYRGS